MASFDRHIGISSGWIAASAFGLISMTAQSYFQGGSRIAALGFWVGIFLLAATVLHLFWLSIFEKKGHHVNGPFVVMAIGLTILIIGMAWNFWPKLRDKDTQESKILAILHIFVECKKSEFNKTNQDGEMYSIEFSPNVLSSMTSGFFTLNTKPYSDISSLNTNSTDIYICSVANYGPSPIFNIYMYFHVVYVERLKDGSIQFENNIVNQRIYSVTINKIENDKNKPFQFYVVNSSEQPGFVEIMDEIKYDQEGGKEKIIGKIKQPEPRYSRMLFLANKIVR